MTVLHSVGALAIDAEAFSTLMHTQFVKLLNVAFITGKKVLVLYILIIPSCLLKVYFNYNRN